MALSQVVNDGSPTPEERNYPVRWYRSTGFNMTILGLCNLAAPGIWGAMNSLGAGGAQSPGLVNAANALTFSLMVVSCYFTSAIIHYIGVKNTLIIGTIGYAPYAAGLYTNNRYGVEWLVLLGAALCGISAGIFWATEAAVAIAYPEPWNKGRALGWWLTFRLVGQTIGGAINLRLNADRDEAGKVSYTVFLVFIALQASGPFVALFLTKPSKVERRDGKKVGLAIAGRPWHEIKMTTKNLLRPEFLLVLLWIGQTVFAEAVFFTYLALWFSVRARALGSFLAGVIGMVVGNGVGAWLDHSRVSIKLRARSTFVSIVVMSGAWWLWATVLATRFRVTQPTYDWSTPGFGTAFAVYVLLNVTFQANYLFLYFIIAHIAKGEPEIVRFAALLRGTESAWQAISYGLSSVTVFAEVGAIYINLGLWALSIYPAWLVIRHIGAEAGSDERQLPSKTEDGIGEASEHKAL
ncbi:Uu.00g012290.m01.CDS01 [Anthostomella pinea]|uniref:Uu.00g012290.m01.CDS01 n=1 Tax=Anthostomella pinea TaxID=933095 RepID=A0AAI8VYU5_9PEZI|nr:Uu.00g012290.m01.CDS01 [Anthostomella pinea]